MCSDVSTFCKNENDMNQELFELFKQKNWKNLIVQRFKTSLENVFILFVEIP